MRRVTVLLGMTLVAALSAPGCYGHCQDPKEVPLTSRGAALGADVAESIELPPGFQYTVEQLLALAVGTWTDEAAGVSVTMAVGQDSIVVYQRSQPENGCGLDPGFWSALLLEATVVPEPSQPVEAAVSAGQDLSRIDVWIEPVDVHASCPPGCDLVLIQAHGTVPAALSGWCYFDGTTCDPFIAHGVSVYMVRV